MHVCVCVQCLKSVSVKEWLSRHDPCELKVLNEACERKTVSDTNYLCFKLKSKQKWHVFLHQTIFSIVIVKNYISGDRYLELKYSLFLTVLDLITLYLTLSFMSNTFLHTLHHTSSLLPLCFLIFIPFTFSFSLFTSSLFLYLFLPVWAGF